MRSPDTLYELTIAVPGPSAAGISAALRALADSGVPAADVVELHEEGVTRLSCYTASRTRAGDIKKQAKGRIDPGSRVLLRAVKRSHWQTKWKSGFKPLRITKHFRVVPLWLQKRCKKIKGVEDIYIGVGMAFGTGTHPTTRAMAGFIEEKRGRFRSFLDIGTGTGILAILAKKCGAGTVHAVDVSPDAVAMAREHAQANECAFEYLGDMDFRDFPVKGCYDLLAANLLAPILISLRAAIVRRVKPGGYLAVSGIWKTDYARFRANFEARPLERVKVVRNSGWVSVLYRRAPLQVKAKNL